MTAKTFFRILVVLTLVGPTGGTIAAYFPGDLSEDWRTVLEWGGNGGIYDHLNVWAADPQSVPLVVSISVGLGLFLLMGLCFSVFVGLFFFWRFARIANVVLTVLGLGLIPWSGLVVLLPLEAVFYDFSMLCGGGVIAMSYSSPIKEHFEAKRSAAA